MPQFERSNDVSRPCCYESHRNEAENSRHDTEDLKRERQSEYTQPDLTFQYKDRRTERANLDSQYGLRFITLTSL
jgi:hypothetical protein